MAIFWDGDKIDIKRDSEKYSKLADLLTENQKRVLVFFSETINHSGTIQQALEASFPLSPEELYKITSDLENLGLVDVLRSYKVHLASSFNGYIEPRTTAIGKAVTEKIKNDCKQMNEEERSEIKIFIGSSTRGLKIAKSLKNHIEEKTSGLIKCTIWNEKRLFKLSYATIDSLIKIAEGLEKDNGYAVLLFTPDDEVTLDKGNVKKESTHLIPRDNVVFELGLFLGRLGRDHVICVRPKNVELRILSDWKGMTDALYRYQKTYTDKCMESPAQQIIEAITEEIDERKSS